MKKLIFLLGVAGLLSACAKVGFQSVHSQTCTVVGDVITCPDGSNTTLPAGPTGPQGTPGSTGSAGNGFAPGLECDVYSIQVADENGTVNWDKMLSDGTLAFSTVVANLNVPNEADTIFSSFTAAQQALVGETNFALDCSGYIDIPETGSYTFTQGSDDGSELAIDSNVVLNMPQLQSYATKSGTVQLFAGRHEVNVLYFQGPPSNMGLTLQIQGPANAGLGTTETVPASVLYH